MRFNHEALMNGEKMPRKMKKRVLGTLMSGKALQKLLNSVVIGKESHTIYEATEIFPFRFCPMCGCKDSKCTGNMAPYPEAYYKEFCARCGYLVGMADNSPFMHALECKKDDYDLEG